MMNKKMISTPMHNRKLYLYKSQLSLNPRHLPDARDVPAFVFCGLHEGSSCHATRSCCRSPTEQRPYFRELSDAAVYQWRAARQHTHDVLHQRADFVQLLADVLHQRADFVQLLADVLNQRADFVQLLAEVLHQRADFVQLLAEVLNQRADFVHLLPDVVFPRGTA